MRRGEERGEERGEDLRPCKGDAQVAAVSDDWMVKDFPDSCMACVNFEWYGGKCMGPWGWRFLGGTALEVAHERTLMAEAVIRADRSMALCPSSAAHMDVRILNHEAVKTAHAATA